MYINVKMNETRFWQVSPQPVKIQGCTNEALKSGRTNVNCAYFIGNDGFGNKASTFLDVFLFFVTVTLMNASNLGQLTAT